jgi:LDH2 family malate/lactate/ureidoglycolate dehydrogenase
VLSAKLRLPGFTPPFEFPGTSTACSGDEEPIVLDMSTAMYAEGKVRAARALGEPLPAGVIVDGQGRPSVDPEDFYRDPHGHILPFGGTMGYKGFGLGVLVEVLGRCLAGLLVSEEDETYRLENGVLMSALDPAAFCGEEAFAEAVADLKAHITSSPPSPGHDSVLMPGGYDDRIRRRRMEEGIPLGRGVRDGLIGAAARVGLTEPDLFPTDG